MTTPVTLIAPVAPFRGGIARHSEALACALAARGDVALEIESFVRLYPRLLYPGESDRDPTGARQLQFSVRYELDTLAPWTGDGLIARVAARGGIAVIPAWTFFVSPALGWIARKLRRKGVKVVAVVHNVADHETRGWKSRLSDWQLAAADAFLTHTADLAAQLAAAGHGQPCVVLPHPAFAHGPEPQGTLPRERALELLCFGLVRHYKGVDIGLKALARSGLTDVRLTVAGEIWEDGQMLRELTAIPELRGRVELLDRYVSDSEAAELIHRADAVLAPYRTVTGSGVLAMAQRYRRPVVASDLSGFAGQIERGKNGWLFTVGDEAALAALLRDEITREAAAAMQMTMPATGGASEWAAYADALIGLVRNG